MPRTVLSNLKQLQLSICPINAKENTCVIMPKKRRDQGFTINKNLRDWRSYDYSTGQI